MLAVVEGSFIHAAPFLYLGLLHAQKSVGWNYLSIPKLQRLHRWSLGMDK